MPVKKAQKVARPKKVTLWAMTARTVTRVPQASKPPQQAKRRVPRPPATR